MSANFSSWKVEHMDYSPPFWIVFDSAAKLPMIYLTPEGRCLWLYTDEPTNPRVSVERIESWPNLQEFLVGAQSEIEFVVFHSGANTFSPVSIGDVMDMADRWMMQ